MLISWYKLPWHFLDPWVQNNIMIMFHSLTRDKGFWVVLLFDKITQANSSLAGINSWTAWYIRSWPDMESWHYIWDYFFKRVVSVSVALPRLTDPLTDKAFRLCCWLHILTITTTAYVHRESIKSISGPEGHGCELLI